MSTIEAYHAHIYYDVETIDRARALCEAARDKFGVEMGRMHEKPVGPHPCWSCQLAFGPDVFADVVPWLALNRDGLVVFLHPETGDVMADHIEHAIWMGAKMELDTSIF